jgi:hypothetical protein
LAYRAAALSVVAFGVALLFASCSARVAATLLARSLQRSRAGGPSIGFELGASLGGLRELFRWALRIAASHAALFVVLLVLARNFADSGNARAAICAYLCVGIVALAAPIWIIGRVFWIRMAGDDRRRGWRSRVTTWPRGFALGHVGALLASLLMLAIAAGLLVRAPAAAVTTSVVTRLVLAEPVVAVAPHRTVRTHRPHAAAALPRSVSNLPAVSNHGGGTNAR